jgi:hypothetical protein
MNNAQKRDGTSHLFSYAFKIFRKIEPCVFYKTGISLNKASFWEKINSEDSKWRSEIISGLQGQIRR